MKIPDPKFYASIGISAIIMLSFVLGMRAGIQMDRKPIPTWGQIVQSMPPSIRQDIAIDYCVAHRGFCQRLPMKSPINPMDSKK